MSIVCDECKKSGNITFTILKGHVECLKELLKIRSIVKQINLNDTLYFATCHGQHKCMEVLIETGAGVNATPIGESYNPLEAASQSGFNNCVKLLLQAGADVNMRGHSALKEAATHGKVECCDLLIKAGADVNTADHLGYTPLMSAAKGIHTYVNHTTAVIECVRLLLRRNAQINRKNKNGFNAVTIHLFYSSQSEPPNKTMVMLLHAAGEKLDGALLVSVLGSVPDYLHFEDLKLCLKHLCREVIRKHLLKLDLHEHLFGRVPRLGLPASTTEYLLYRVSLGLDDFNKSKM